jgi:hypothetical protein
MSDPVNPAKWVFCCLSTSSILALAYAAVGISDVFLYFTGASLCSVATIISWYVEYTRHYQDGHLSYYALLFTTLVITAAYIPAWSWRHDSVYATWLLVACAGVYGAVLVPAVSLYKRESAPYSKSSTVLVVWSVISELLIALFGALYFVNLP